MGWETNPNYPSKAAPALETDKMGRVVGVVGENIYLGMPIVGEVASRLYPYFLGKAPASETRQKTAKDTMDAAKALCSEIEDFLIKNPKAPKVS